MTRRIYKLLTLAQWADFQADGQFVGAPIDLKDGYIHFSAKDQVAETADKHFSEHNALILAACDAHSFGQALKWEPSRGGALFPHLYSVLSLSAIEGYWTLKKNGERFAFPEDF